MILNLDPEFSPFGESVINKIEFDAFNFPSHCEMHIKIQSCVPDEKTMITTRIKSANDIMLLLLATDALRRTGIKEINLLIPYLPYARQDRVMVPGEPLSLKVMADLINSQNYNKVIVFDPHSEVSAALINNIEVWDNFIFVNKALTHKKDYLIISPDAGAYKKIFTLCKKLQYHGEIITCNKIRDVSNGVIRSLTISHDDLQGKDCYIIDDICDGGGTFTLLAEELRKRNAGSVNLIVSHGILSKGIDALIGIDKIYTTNSFQDFDHHPKLTQIKL